MINLRHQSLAFALLVPSIAVAQTHRAAQSSDSQILGKVQNVLHDEHAFAGSFILPSISHGVVTLTGNVRSEAEKELASRDLADIAGIKTVLNNLEVHDNAFKPAPLTKAAPGLTGPQTITLPPNTILSVRLSDEIDTKRAKANDSFRGLTAAAVVQGTTVLIPAGTPVSGRVVDAKAASHFNGYAVLSLELVGIRLPEATQDASLVTEQLSNKAAGRGANTAEKAGGGAALSAVVGALAGGGNGAGIGAASGGALGLGANAITRGTDIDLKPEQLLQFRTAAPLQVTIMLVDGKQVVPQPAAPGQLHRVLDHDQALLLRACSKSWLTAEAPCEGWDSFIAISALPSSGFATALCCEDCLRELSAARLFQLRQAPKRTPPSASLSYLRSESVVHPYL